MGGMQGGHGRWHLGLLLGGLPSVEMLFLGIGFMDNPGFAGSNVAFDGACAGEDTQLVPTVCFALGADNA